VDDEAPASASGNRRIGKEQTHAMQHIAPVIRSPRRHAVEVLRTHFDLDQRNQKSFFTKGRLFFRAIDNSSFAGVFNMEDFAMVENVTRIPVQNWERVAGVPSATQAWAACFSHRREMDRLFDDFGRALWQLPTRRSGRKVSTSTKSRQA
jgi:hypothetical protein